MSKGSRKSPRAGVTTFGKIVGALWYIVVCGIFLFGGSIVGLAAKSPLLWKMATSVVTGAPPAQDVFKQDAATFLILGCDEDLYYQGQSVLKHKARSDMMLVARLNFKNQSITGVSIPRDTWCKLPGYSEHKINAYHAIAKWGQEDQLTKDAVEHLIGVKIDKVITLDYGAFQNMVDIVGGVWVNVPKQMDYDDNAGNLHVHLKPGRQKLSGYDAMCYVRYRHSNDGVADTDFDRQNRQKDLLLGFKQAALGNVLNLPEIVNSAKGVLGGALNDEQITSLAFFAKNVKPGGISMGVIPTSPAGKGLRLDKGRLPEVLAQYKLDQTLSEVTMR